MRRRLCSVVVATYIASMLATVRFPIFLLWIVMQFTNNSQLCLLPPPSAHFTRVLSVHPYEISGFWCALLNWPSRTFSHIFSLLFAVKCAQQRNRPHSGIEFIHILIFFSKVQSLLKQSSFNTIWRYFQLIFKLNSAESIPMKNTVIKNKLWKIFCPTKSF